MSATVSRRAVLLAGAGLVVGAACGRDRNASTATTSTRPAALSLLTATFEPLAGSDQRLSFGVIRGQAPVGPQEEVTIAIGPVTGALGAPMKAVRRAEGIEERPLHVVRTSLPEPGNYRAVARVGTATAEAAFTVVAPGASSVPVPGGPLVSLPTPTTADKRGVDPICTRQPPCPWHEVSLDAAIAEKRPLVVLFSTPALCQSAVCGPVLDILLGLKQEFERRVRFVHLEIFTDRTGKTTTPAVQAFKLQNEPFLFLAGPDGKVRERIDGPYDRGEAIEALRRLTA